jgi:light-regulated signal transduction histidine kinase (bacteriophytochrome)
MDSQKDKPAYKELSRALADSEEAYRELSVLAYSVAHDLRAPLRSIESFAQILLDDHADQLNEAGKGYLRRMQSGGRNMGELIEALLKLVSLARGEVRRVDVDLSAAAESIAAGLRRVGPARQVEFVIQPGLKAPGDPDLLAELLENLLGNAWKFTSRHPRARIEFGSTIRDGITAFFVRDDGAGFDPRHAGKLFAPFQRLHGASEFPGVGAGLAVVKRIARLHRGRVAAEGDVEKGATVYFTLWTEAEPGEVS